MSISFFLSGLSSFFFGSSRSEESFGVDADPLLLARLLDAIAAANLLAPAEAFGAPLGGAAPVDDIEPGKLFASLLFDMRPFVAENFVPAAGADGFDSAALGFTAGLTDLIVPPDLAFGNFGAGTFPEEELLAEPASLLKGVDLLAPKVFVPALEAEGLAGPDAVPAPF